MTRLVTIVICLAIVPCILSQLVLPVYKRPPKINIPRTDAQYIDIGGGLFTSGEFYTQITIGTPGAPFEVQLDTGSSDLLVYDVSCSKSVCENPAAFSRGASSSEQLISCDTTDYYCRTCYSVASAPTCGFQNAYGSGAVVSGYLLTDDIGIGNLKVKANFGAIIAVNGGLFQKNVTSGIWGMAYQVISSYQGPTYFDLLVKEASLYNGFSMCLSDTQSWLSLGSDYSKNTAFTWTTIVAEQYYNVMLNQVTIGNTNLLASPTSNAIVDSGSTAVLLSVSAFNGFANVLRGMCPDLKGICGVTTGRSLLDGFCYQMTASDRAQFPTFKLTLNEIGTTFSFPSSKYFINQGGFWCLGIANSTQDIFVLGDVFMQDYHVVFDRQNKKVGFGPLSTCPTSATSGQQTHSSSSTLWPQMLVIVAASFVTIARNYII